MMGTNADHVRDRGGARRASLRARLSLVVVAVLGIGLAASPVALGTAPASAEQAQPAPSPTPRPGAGPSATARGVPSALKGHRHAKLCASAAPGSASCLSEVDLNVRGPLATPAAVPAGYGAGDLQAAYSLASATNGRGRTVAVVVAYDDPTAAADLATYRAKYGLPPCGAGCFTKLDQRGGTSFPTTVDASTGAWNSETATDLAMVSAACPNCNIVLVEADSALMSDLAMAAATAAGLPGVVAVSNSYGGPEFPGETAYDTFYNHPGITVTVASGDSGYAGGVMYPAASPYVTAVGGTRLVLSADGSWQQTAAGIAGSGCSAYEPKPAWQTDTGCATRTVADLSYVADPSTGVAVYNSSPYSGSSTGWLVVGGTSVAAPLAAGASALGLRQDPTAYPAQKAYTSTGGVTDVVSGSNGTCGVSYLCTAGRGYDGPTGVGAPTGAAALTSSFPGQITSLAPYRQLDTRDGTGGTAGPVGPGATVRVRVAGRGGVPASGVSAVVVNVTETQPTQAGHLTVYAGGAPLPGTSNVNFVAGETAPNLVIAPVGADGTIAITNSSQNSGTVQIIADTFGYILSGSASTPGALTSLAPYRQLDTRDGTGGTSGPVAAGATVRVHVLGRGGVPATGVSAVVVNVTVTQPTQPGHLRVYAGGALLPGTSNVNFIAGQTVPNLVMAPVGADGTIAITNSQNGGTVQIVADTFGYVLSGVPSAGGMSSLAPYRQLDTRDGTGGTSGPVGPGATVRVHVAGRGGVPASGLAAVVVNVTVTDPTQAGHLTVYAGDGSLPGTSNVNFVAGQTAPNLVIAPVGADGTIAITNSSQNSGTVQIIADTFGYVLG